MHEAGPRLQLVVFFTLIYKSNALNDGCFISLNQDLTDPQPLLLNPNSNEEDAFVKPNNSSGIYLQSGDRIQIACPKSSIKINTVSLNTPMQLATCINGKIFQIADTRVNFSQITCSKQPSTDVVVTNSTCLTQYTEVKIGFELEDGRFLNLMYCCFDQDAQNTLYSVSNLSSAIGAYQTNYPRPVFMQTSNYKLGAAKLDTLYTRNTQRTTINALLNLNGGSYKYVQSTNDYYLARGHLSPKTDYLFGSQQRATFYFVNAAPQWQTLNAGNWLILEDNVRALASDKNLDLVVYTGTYGVSKLPNDETGEDTELYLYVNGNEKAIPVPELFWKVVYEPVSKAGVAFLAVNNPYVTDYEKLCEDVCEKISWVSWKSDDQKSGFGYCCDVDEFREIVKTVPNFIVNMLI